MLFTLQRPVARRHVGVQRALLHPHHYGRNEHGLVPGWATRCGRTRSSAIVRQSLRLWVRAGAYCAQHLTEVLITERHAVRYSDKSGTATNCGSRIVGAGTGRRLPLHDWDHSPAVTPTGPDAHRTARAPVSRPTGAHARASDHAAAVTDEPPEDVTPRLTCGVALCRNAATPCPKAVTPPSRLHPTRPMAAATPLGSAATPHVAPPPDVVHQ